MAWSVAQSAKGENFGSSVAATFTAANVSSGNKIIVVLASAFDAAPSSVTDAASNAWTPLGSGGSASEPTVFLYGLDVPAADAGTKPTITVAIAGPLDLKMIILEVSGLLAGNTTAMLDGTPGTLGGSTANTGSPAYSSAAAGEFLLCAYGSDTGTAPAGPGGWTLDANSGTGADATCSAAYTNSTGGAETSGFTGTGAGPWGVLTVAFKLAPSGTDTSPAYATAAADLGGGAGSWTSPGSADGAADSTYATWVAP